jgi:thioredoxin 1
MTTTLTDVTFDEVVGASELPILVDFWAEWCGPCRAVGPVLEELAGEHGDDFTLAKLDIDANPATAARFGVMSIPTMVLIKDGSEAVRLVGARGKEQLRADLLPHL